MENKTKRFLKVALVLMLVVAMLPQITIGAKAADTADTVTAYCEHESNNQNGICAIEGCGVAVGHTYDQATGLCECGAKEAPKSDAIAAYTSATTIWGETWGNARKSYAIKVLDASGNVMGTTTLNTKRDVSMDGDVKVSWHITLPGNADADECWIQEWTIAPTLGNMPAKVELWIDGVKTSESAIQLNGPDGINKIVAVIANANSEITGYATTFAAALTAAPDNGTVKLLSGPNVAISAAGEVTGNKTVTVTGTAKFDWGKGWLMVGRGSNPGDGKLIFKDATITSASSATNTALGFNISGAKKNDPNTCNGSVEFINSNIETDYLLNAGNMTVDGGNLYVHHGFKVSGRAASDSASGEDATATMTVTNGAVVKIKNENTMGIGNEGNGILNLENSTFECLSTMNIADEDGSAFNVSGTSTLNIKSVSGQSINLLDGAIIKDSTVGGDGSVDGNVTFRGNNTFNNLYDFGDYYFKETPSMWTVEKGASLTLTNSVGNPYGLGYGDNVTVNGSLENALTARETLTEGKYSFYAEKGIRLSTSAGNDAANGSFVTVNNAYAVIGKIGSFSNSKTYGKFTIALNNSVIDAAQIFFSDSNDVIDLSISGSDVLTGIFMTADKDSTYAVNNSKMVVTASGNDRYNGNDGALTVKNSTIEIKTGTYKNNGTLTLDAASTLTAPSITGEGTIIIDATGLEEGKSAKVIDQTNGTSLEGKVTVNNLPAGTTVSYADGDVTLTRATAVATIGEARYFTLKDAIDAVKDGDTITLIDGVTGDEHKTKIPFNKEIEFTITGNAPDYVIPIISLKDEDGADGKRNVMNIVNANFKTAELDARQESTINVKNSTLYGYEVDDVIKAYYDGVINITGNSYVNTMQLTTTGRINISGGAVVSNSTRTNIMDNGIITIGEGSKLITSGLWIGKDYNRDNTDSDRVGQPATLLVDGGVVETLSENSSYYYNTGTAIIGETNAALIKVINGGSVDLNHKNGATVAANGAIEVDGGALSVGKGLTNNGTVTVSGESTLTAPSITGEGTIIIDATGLEEGKSAKVIDQTNGTSLEGKVEIIGENVIVTYGTDGDVTIEKAVAYIREQGYASLQAAINAAADRDTVKLLADIDLGEATLVIDKAITLDTNDHKLTAKEVQLNNAGAALVAPEGMTVITNVPGKQIAYSNAESTYVVADIKLNASNMTLGNTLGLNFLVEVDQVKNADEVVAVLTRDDVEVKRVTLSDTENVKKVTFKVNNVDVEFYQICYDGIAAKEMNDEVSVQIFKDGKAISNKFTDSVVEYAKFMFANSNDKELHTMLVDMLNYGAAAQKAFNYNTDNLANRFLTAKQQEELATKNYGKNGDNVLTDAWKGNGIGYGSNLELKDNIILHIWFKSAGVDKAVITYTDHYGDNKSTTVEAKDFTPRMTGVSSVAVDTLVVADGYQLVKVELYKGGKIDTVEESIESYLAYMLSKDSDNALYDATAKFITSAKAYFKSANG